MSWGEVKKINSDVSVPLDMLLKNRDLSGEAIIPKRASINLTNVSEETTIYEVEGTGYIKSLLAVVSFSYAECIARIYIDGKKTHQLHCGSGTAYYGNTNAIGVIHKDYIGLAGVDSNSKLNLFRCCLVTTLFDCSMCQLIDFAPNDEYEIVHSSGNQRSFLTPIDDVIKFEHGFKITLELVTGSSCSTTINAIYKLA